MPRPLIPHRRDRILDAAERLVLARGFDAMSIAAVAEDAGIAKGSVYREFTSKRDVRDALLQRGNARIAARVEQELGAHPSLAAAYRATARALLDDELMTAAFLDNTGVLGAHVAEEQDGRYRERHERVIAWVHDLQRRGVVVADVAPESLALALSSATLGLLSAARLLGPLNRDRLESTIDTIGRMAATFERQ
ncbi:TetR/AcrR family transcriptional regulator [Microbacterium sufflavum]|uniref:TetR/AcrR family transcriptional regulator n=1 Tax=Microbacterium sufflavum TaxID=2851649 RepID=A0ABY4IJL9_9MICO|nr:TetR/AcrR family transcriptional regulator [Microbacterium sufflavum]UPL11798.1 TetR/AcrR family transcriptional regulator [Microbacterium sufflavum]